MNYFQILNLKKTVEKIGSIRVDAKIRTIYQPENEKKRI